MCAKTIPILRKTSYDFTSLGSSAEQTIVIVPAIDVAAYYRADLHIRIHANGMSASQLVHFELNPTLPSDEDPAEFLERDGTGAPIAIATLDIDNGDSAPLALSTSGTGLGAALRVQFTATQSGIAGTPFFIELSGVLILRNF